MSRDDTEQGAGPRTVVNGGNAPSALDTVDLPVDRTGLVASKQPGKQPKKQPSPGSLYQLFSELRDSITADDDGSIRAQVEIETTKHRWDGIVTISTSKTGLAAIGLLGLVVVLFFYWVIGGFDFEATTEGVRLKGDRTEQAP